MIYQTLKYFLARMGLTVFFILTLGFLGLFILHEIALPQAVLNDSEVQWGLLGVCAFFGWIGHGLVGEMRVSNGLHKLGNIDLAKDESETHKRFDDLFALTYSSCFLPGKGKRFRQRLFQLYADYLLALGREDHEAMRVYLKAFLQNPQDSVFRAPIIAILTRELGLGTSPEPSVRFESEPSWSEEIDLLVVMMRLDNYKDAAIANLLAGLFLKKREFSVRSEPLFVSAVENESADAARIVQFVSPFYLQKNRSDHAALKFYLLTLSYDLPQREEMQKILARAYYQGVWQETDAPLHRQCGEVFSLLDKAGQEAVARAVNESMISAKTQKYGVIGREEVASLKKMKVSGSVAIPDIGHTKKTISGSARSLRSAFKRVIYGLLELLRYFGLQIVRFKLVFAILSIVLLSAKPAYKYWKESRQVQTQPNPVIEEVTHALTETKNGSKVYTVQIAAVFTQGQSKKIIDFVQGQGVEGLYVVESQRVSGGKWYKIRFGKYSNKEEAQRVAEDLMEKKIIKNYFVLSVEKKD